jgi:NADPH:quinone reductase-like Zn-dependent oxidoreductase
MKRVVIPKSGDANILQVQESPDLTPAKGEVSIQVKAAGINFADILARQGLYQDAPAYPCTVGYEVSGIVDQVGEGVDQALIGTAVIALTRFNGQASQVIVPEVQVFPKPEKLSFEQAAALPVNYLTAWQGLVIGGALQPEDSVLIHNVGGGVGLAALEIAQHIGATTIGTASGGKHPFLKEKGLDHAIDYRNDDWTKELDKITAGKGVELILDPIGGKSWKQSYKALRSTGRLGMFGISTAAGNGLLNQWRLLKLIVQIPFFHPVPLMHDNRGVFGINLGRLWHEPEKIRNWMDKILQGIDQGWINPQVDKVFKFEEAAAAHTYIENRQNKGKVVLIP